MGYSKECIKQAPISAAIIAGSYVWKGIYPGIAVVFVSNLIDAGILVYKEEIHSTLFIKNIVPYLILLAVNYLVSLIQKWADLKLEMQLAEKINLKVTKKRASLKYSDVETPEMQELFQRITEEPSIRIKEGFLNFLDFGTYAVQTVSITLILMKANFGIAVLILCVSFPVIWIAQKCGEYDYAAYEKTSKKIRKTRMLQEALSSRNFVQERELFGYSEYLNRYWNKEYEDVIRISTKADIRSFVQIKGANILTLFIQIFTMGILLFALVRGEMSLGMYIGIIKAQNDLVQKITWEFTQVARKAAKNRIYWKDYQTIMHLEEDKAVLEDREGKKTLQTIEFRNVSFTYPGTSKKILKGLNMKLEAGKKYAFVGENGAGKTTIIKLLTGIYDTYEGEILIDGKERRTLDGRYIKSVFSILFQDFQHFEISIRENLLLGNGSIEEDRLYSILEQVSLLEKVNKLENGLDTKLGKIAENGHDFSGGEWQKLVMARCILRDAPVLLLDEPTSAMDPLSEADFQKNVSRIGKEKMLLIITHRLGTVKAADEILVLQGGCICEQGSHSELMEKNGLYHSMYEAQRSWYYEKA